MKCVTDFFSFSFYNFFSSSVEIHAAWTESKSDDAVINNAYDILRIREKSVKNILKCNQKHTTSLISYLEHFNDSQSESSVRMSVSKHCNTCFEMSNEDNEYYSYANEANFTVTIWFYIRKLFKNDVINFFEQCVFD